VACWKVFGRHSKIACLFLQCFLVIISDWNGRFVVVVMVLHTGNDSCAWPFHMLVCYSQFL
jgi:hypothetical protein